MVHHFWCNCSRFHSIPVCIGKRSSTECRGRWPKCGISICHRWSMIVDVVFLVPSIWLGSVLRCCFRIPDDRHGISMSQAFHYSTIGSNILPKFWIVVAKLIVCYMRRWRFVFKRMKFKRNSVEMTYIVGAGAAKRKVSAIFGNETNLCPNIR